MDRILFHLGDMPISFLDACIIAASIALALLGWLAIAQMGAGRARLREETLAEERQRDLDDRLAGIMRDNAELAGRLRAMSEIMSTGQSHMARAVTERLDAVGLRVGQGLEQSSLTTGQHLAKLNERLAVIDAAQTRLTGLTQEVVGLKDILANKQSRGAFGQGRMEAIVRDGLPPGQYEFQYALSSGTRPDCIIRLPGDDRVMVIDAKFPLEAFNLLRAAQNDGDRKIAAQRVRTDMGKHIGDIAQRYFLPGETQDIAMLFVPSESLHADLHEHFDDLVQKAHHQRIIIVSPSLLMLAVQVMQSIVRDARLREQAHVIQKEVRLLAEDIGRLRERVGNLGRHFQAAQKDVEAIETTTTKILIRSERIDQIECADPKSADSFAADAQQPRAAE